MCPIFSLSRLNKYVQCGGVEGVQVWLEGSSGSVEKQLDVNISLKENFSNCVITEFPILHISMKNSGLCEPLANKDSQQQLRCDIGVCCEADDGIVGCAVSDDKGKVGDRTVVYVRGEHGGKRDMDESHSMEEGESISIGGCPSLHLICQSYGQSDSSGSDN